MPGFGTRFSNPSVLPAGPVYAVAFTAASDAVATADFSSPYVSVYSWSASGFGAKFANPATLPTGTCYGVAFTQAGDAIAVGHENSPRITAYPWSGAGFGTKFSNPATLPTGFFGDELAFTNNGNALAIASDASPYVTAYPWSGAGFGTKFSNPATLPTGAATSVAFTSSGNALAVSHGNSPFISVYPWSGAGFGTKFSNPGTLPAEAGLDVRFSNADDAIAIGHNGSPFISVYPWSGAGFGTKFSNPGTLPAGVGRDVAFSPSGDTLAIAHATTPFISTYPWSAGGFGTKNSDPSELPPASLTAFAVAFAPSGGAIAVGSDASPYIYAYRWGDIITITGDVTVPMQTVSGVITQAAYVPLLDLFNGAAASLASHISDSGHTWTVMGGSAVLNGSGRLTLNSGLAWASAVPVFTNEYSVTGQFMFPLVSTGADSAIVGRLDNTTGYRYQARVTPTYVACGSAPLAPDYSGCGTAPVRVTYSLVQYSSVPSICFYIEASNAPGVYVGGIGYCSYDHALLQSIVSGYQATADVTYNNALATYNACRLSIDATYATALAVYNACLDSNKLTIRLEQITVSGTVVLGTYVVTRFVTDIEYAVTLELKDAAKKILVNGVEVISSNDNTITAVGRPGVSGTGTYLNSISTVQENFASGSVTVPMQSTDGADTNMFVPMQTVSGELEGGHIVVPMQVVAGGTNDADITVPLQSVESGTNGADIAVPMQHVVGYGSADYGAVTVPMQTVTGSISPASKGAVTVPMQSVSAVGHSGGLGKAAVTVPMQVVDGGTGSGGNVTLPMQTVVGVVLTGTVGEASVSAPMSEVTGTINSENLGTAELSCPMPSVDGYVLVGTVGNLNVILPMALLSAEGLTGTISTAEITVPMQTLDASGYPAFTGSAQIFIPMATVEAVAFGPVPQPTRAYVMNLKHHGVTEYTNFPFNSFANFNGELLAAGASGIFALTGDLDDAGKIAAKIRTGRMGFGSEQLKRVKDVFISYRSDGPMRLTAIMEEGETFIYNLEARSKLGLRNSRAKMGRALKSKYWQFEVANIDGEDFSIDTMHFDPQELSRKLG